jgi:hypothetical protein
LFLLLISFFQLLESTVQPFKIKKEQTKKSSQIFLNYLFFSALHYLCGSRFVWWYWLKANKLKCTNKKKRRRKHKKKRENTINKKTTTGKSFLLYNTFTAFVDIYKKTINTQIIFYKFRDPVTVYLFLLISAIFRGKYSTWFDW